MTFWAIAYGLLVVVTGAVILGALRRRDTREVTPGRLYAERRAELAQDLAAGAIANDDAGSIEAELAQATLAEEDGVAKQAVEDGPRRAALILCAVLVPLIALPMYLHLGSPRLADAPAGGKLPELRPDQLIPHLESQAAKDPKNYEVRFMLGRAYMAAQRYDRAAQEFEQVLGGVGEQATLLVEYADALAMQSGGKLAGKPAELAARALALEPENVTALWLTGMAENEAGKRGEALQHLRQARKAARKSEIPTDDLDGMIASLEAGLGSAAPPDTEIPEADPHAGPAPGGPSLEVKVGISEELRARLPADATLFVFARAKNGMPMPLAVVRLPVSALPATVTLDDSKAMAPQAALSRFDTVEIVARVSRSGKPLPTPGDFEGSVPSVATASRDPVAVTIDRVVP
ncbi:MAG: c-type cytochrome biogenesis protein CcmI [Gammaproteobacteria bacterium]|nr:c-type cytochrome biogenesis protein CcmI [Gammaproteobacteria bacterium]MBI5615209.1 c-type cytochrome biogenesis protein CcmI [Gammaproteobacteria bacterium]